MILKLEFNLLLALFFILNLNQRINTEKVAKSDDKCFRAAVYEHIKISEPINDPLKILNNNFAIYERVIKRASFVDTKIIVFPEYGLFPSLSRDELLSKGVVPFSPVLNSNLCAIYKEKLKNITQGNYSDLQKSEQMQLLDKETEVINEKVLVNKELLRKTSCLAQENKIYIAINLVTLEKKNDLNGKSPVQKTKELSNLEESTSELETLKKSDQLINDKLTDLLNKINEKELKQNLRDSKLEDFLLFNTQLVFDNQGKLIAKYRKFHLYGENALNRTDLELVTFDSPYGKFGLSICFDILYEQPIKGLVEKEKIDHLIYSTSWMNDLPSLTAMSFQSAVSTKNKINFLSANIRNFPLGYTGTAIYNGKTGVRLQTSFDNHDRLLIADLPIGSLNNQNDDSSVSASEKIDIQTVEYSNFDSLNPIAKVDVNEFDKGKCSHYEPVRITEETYQEFSYLFKDNTFLSSFKPLQVPLDLFKTKRLESTEGKLENVCDKNICCSLEWKMNDKFNFASDNYYLGSISRLKQSTLPEITWYEEACALISYHQFKPEYKLVSSTHFDKLVLRGKFNTTEIYPSILSSALYVVPKHKWQFKQVYNEAELSFDNLKRPITFVSLYGRNYNQDPVIH